ncbi:hypothetical protein [Streptomyces sp. NPDC004285]
MPRAESVRTSGPLAFPSWLPIGTTSFGGSVKEPNCVLAVDVEAVRTVPSQTR